MKTIAADLKVADEAWIAAALLHRERPSEEDFTVNEILERARRESLNGELRPGVYVHINTHCVANRAPSPAPYRMLFETRPGRRRLFRAPDQAHLKRNGKTHPRRQDVPEQYHYLIDWYENEYQSPSKDEWLLAVLEMAGRGKDLWRDETPDSYVHRLREGWN